MKVVFCDGGLSNRLNALVFALILRQRYGHEWRICWPINNWCGAKFETLFKIDLPIDNDSIEFFKQNEHKYKLLLHENQCNFAEDLVVYQQQLKDYSDYETILNAHENVLYFNNSIPAFVDIQDIRDAIQDLFLSDGIRRTVIEICEQNCIDDSVLGLHIRKTDFGDTVDDQALFEMVKTHSAKFFVCSDSQEVSDRFSELNNCFIFPKTSYPEKLNSDNAWQAWTTDPEGRQFPFNILRSEGSIVEALVDLLILSKTKLVKTSNSTFFTMAQIIKHTEAFSAQLSPIKATMNNDSVTQGEILNLLNLIRPWHMADETKIRIGADADGGYVLPSRAQHSNLVLSIGIGDEVSFDKALAKCGAKIFQFDHTISDTPSDHPNIKFFAKGWGVHDTPPLLSLQSMINIADWSQAVYPILKFDTEGAEWDCLNEVNEEDLARFEIITGEFHGFQNLLNRDFFEKVKSVWSKLAKTHYVVHLHANNAGGLILIGGIPMPRLLELTFLRKESATFTGHSREPIPGPLDRPNLAGFSDLYLRAF